MTQIDWLKQFNHWFHRVVKSVDQDNIGILNYKKAVRVLTDLGFMHSHMFGKNHNNTERQLMFDIWRNLKGNENNGINIRNFKLFLLAVMRFNYSWMKLGSLESDMQLSISNSKLTKYDNKHLSGSKNTFTPDNLSAIHPDISNWVVNMKVKQQRPIKFDSVSSKPGFNPSLQRFLNNKIPKVGNDKENHDARMSSPEMSQNFYQTMNSPNRFNLSMGNDFMTRVLSPTLRSKQAFSRWDSARSSWYDTVTVPRPKGTFGIFDNTGDFYFLNDKELEKVSEYFYLFFVNRVEYEQNEITFDIFKNKNEEPKTYWSSEVIKNTKMPISRIENTRKNTKNWHTSYQKYLSTNFRPKRKNLSSYREVKTENESVGNWEFVPGIPQPKSTKHGKRSYNCLNNFYRFH